MTKKKVGFAAMDPEKVRKIASRGAKALHKKGRAHKFTSEEAKVAGSKGGKAPRRKKVRDEDTKDGEKEDVR